MRSFVARSLHGFWGGFTYETLRCRPATNSTKKEAIRCIQNQFRCSALRVLLQAALRQIKAGLVCVAVMAHVSLARIAQADFALEIVVLASGHVSTPTQKQKT
jgi:hypothetical protein